MNAEIEDNIRKNVSWNLLPVHIKQTLNSNVKTYERMVKTFSIKNQLRYRGNLVRHILNDEKHYYERVIAYSRVRLMLFPYHLADMIVKGLRITPFNYYVSVVEDLIQNERSYDTLPNFTAADCLRLLGIGRNEYIELMNKARSNRGRLFGKKNVRGFLPRVPCDIPIKPWWRVEIGLVLEEDVKMVNEEELAVIDCLIDLGSQTAGELNYNVVISLYKKGLIYLDVPITGADCIQVPPLQGFVMNRILGDYFETLLYKIFVSIDEHTTVSELAGVLQIDTELVKQAVSLYCRLQFARKVDPETERDRDRRHPSWNVIPTSELRTVEITPLTLSLSKENLNHENDSPDSPANSNTLNRKGQRVAFIFDSTLTAFLMMGNLSPDLKKHAVTMFEVGKLCDESLDSFLLELEKVSVLDADGEGEARRYFDHAVILRSTILALRKLPFSGLDLVRLESLHSLDEATCSRLLQKKYKLLVSMAPLSGEVRPIVSLSPPHLGPAVPEVNSLWFKLYLYHVTGYGPPSLLLVKGTKLEHLPRMFFGHTRLLVTSWCHEPAVIPSVNILHVNAAAQYAPVLIQAYGVHQPADVCYVPFPFHPEATPLDQSQRPFHQHPSVKTLENVLNLSNNCGYLTFANVGVMDFGCVDKPKTVKLRRRGEPLSMANENFRFEKEEGLRSPDEEHFAMTPNSTGSPANGFTSQECSELLQQELDALENKPLTVDNLVSPTEETIDMFSRLGDEEPKKEELRKEENYGEAWTLLDCHFGIPLFDVNANTKICDTIVSGGLAETKSLDCLVESSRKLGANLLDFISQCQYYPGESMEIMKRGRLVPLPRYSLVFDNGRISEWCGK